MVELSKLPKLRVKYWSLGSSEDEITCDFEQAKDIIFDKSPASLVFTEGEIIYSYEELTQLAVQEKHKDKKVLNVTLLVSEIGGG